MERVECVVFLGIVEEVAGFEEDSLGRKSVRLFVVV